MDGLGGGVVGGAGLMGRVGVVVVEVVAFLVVVVVLGAGGGGSPWRFGIALGRASATAGPVQRASVPGCSIADA